MVLRATRIRSGTTDGLMILVALVALLAVIAFLTRGIFEAFAVTDSLAAASASSAAASASDPAFLDLNDPGNQLMCKNEPWRCPGQLFDIQSQVNVGKRLYFRDRTGSAAPAAANNTDPYYLEKTLGSGSGSSGTSSLRLTINDNPGESLEVWAAPSAASDASDASGASGGASGSASGASSAPSGWQHRLRADGGAAHRGGVLVGDGGASSVQDAFGYNFGVSSYNPTTGAYTHLPFKDGKNYITGDVVLDQRLCINGTCVAEADVANIKGLKQQDQQIQQQRQALDGLQVSIKAQTDDITSQIGDQQAKLLAQMKQQQVDCENRRMALVTQHQREIEALQGQVAQCGREKIAAADQARREVQGVQDQVVNCNNQRNALANDGQQVRNQLDTARSQFSTCSSQLLQAQRQPQQQVVVQQQQPQPQQQQVAAQPQPQPRPQQAVAAPVAAPAGQSVLNSSGNNQLTKGQSLVSPDGRFKLIVQNDNNVVVYGPSGATWSTSTNGQNVASLRMQSDGNLVVYNTSEAAVWVCCFGNTAGNGKMYYHGGATSPPYKLTMQNDGNLVIYDRDNRVPWSIW